MSFFFFNNSHSLFIFPMKIVHNFFSIATIVRKISNRSLLADSESPAKRRQQQQKQHCLYWNANCNLSTKGNIVVGVTLSRLGSV